MDTPTADPRPFLRHQHLAILWCRYNNRRPTASAVVSIMNRLTADTLERMLTVRGVATD